MMVARGVTAGEKCTAPISLDIGCEGCWFANRDAKATASADPHPASVNGSLSLILRPAEPRQHRVESGQVRKQVIGVTSGEFRL